MKPKHLIWLLAATFIIWVLPWQAKRLYPTIFGSSYIQWASVIISAPLLSLGMFFSIHAVFSYPDQRRDSGWACIGFIALFSLILGLYGLTDAMLSRLSYSADTVSTGHLIPLLIQKLQEVETEEERKDIAKTIYIFSGVSVPYESENGTYITYQSTKKDKERWILTQQSENKIKDTKEILNRQLKQLPCLTFLYIGSFFMTFFIGLLILIYKKKNSELDR